LRHLWQLRVEHAHILSVRTHLRAEFQLDRQKSPEPGKRRGWMYSPFRIPDLASWDHTRRMTAVRDRLRQAKEALRALDPKLLELFQIRARVSEGQGDAYTREAISSTPSTDGDHQPGLIECFFPEETLKKPSCDLLAVHEFVTAGLRARLAGLGEAKGVSHQVGDWPLSDREVLDQVRRTIGESLATALGLRLLGENRTLQDTLAAYVQLAWGTQVLPTGEYLRMLSGLFLLRRLEGPTDSDADISWVLDIADAAVLLDESLGDQPASSVFHTDLRRARAVLLGAGLPFDELTHSGGEALLHALAEAWNYAILYGKKLVDAFPVAASDSWATIDGRADAEFPGLTDVALFRALLIKEPAFARVLRRESLRPDLAAGGVLIRAANNYATALAQLEALIADRGSWSLSGALRLRALSPEERIRIRDEMAAVARSEQHLRMLAHGEVSALTPSCKAESFTSPRSRETRGCELLAAFRPIADQSLAGVGTFLVKRSASSDLVPFGQLIRDFVECDLKVRSVSLGGRPVSEPTDTVLIRWCQLEIECLTSQVEWIRAGGRRDGEIVSFNITPWLSCPEKNQWAGAYVALFQHWMSVLIDALYEKGARPVIEITEGILPEGEDGTAFWRFIASKAREGVLGVAVDDQFGPDTGFERMNTIIARARTAGIGFVIVKIDHTAVKTVTDAARRRGSSTSELSSGFSHFLRLVGWGVDDVDIVVFEGLSGWDKTPATHRPSMLEALAMLPQTPEIQAPEILAQG
jgi:hypothetical protein